MNSLIERPIILFAWIVAGILVLVGVRKFALHPERKAGLFSTSLAFFLILSGVALESGCSNSTGSTPATADSATQTSTGEDPIQQSPVEQTQHIEDTKTQKSLPIPELLAQGDRWQRFRQFWQKLDRVEPKSQGSYLFSIDREQKLSFDNELASIFGLPKEKLRHIALRGDQIDFLSNVLLKVSLHRIDRMFIDPTMMTRMMPPPPLPIESTPNRAILEMEQRIDSLQKLSESGNVSPEALQSSLEKIQKNVYLFSLLRLTSGYHSQLSIKAPAKAVKSEYQNALNDPDAWILEIEKSKNKRAKHQSPFDRNTMEENYKNLMENIEKLRQNKARLDLLIADLER